MSWCSFKHTLGYGIILIDVWLNGREKTINEVLKQKNFESSVLSNEKLSLSSWWLWFHGSTVLTPMAHASTLNLHRPVCPGWFKALHRLPVVNSTHSATIPFRLQAQECFLLLLPVLLVLLQPPGEAQAGHPPSCLHMPQGFLCWFWMKPVMVCRGCICSDFRLHHSSHRIFSLSVPAMFMQHCSWAAICDGSCLLRLVNVEAVQ